jgi:hypothetical protein
MSSHGSTGPVDIRTSTAHAQPVKLHSPSAPHEQYVSIDIYYGLDIRHVKHAYECEDIRKRICLATL